jgi:hypothetical protein
LPKIPSPLACLPANLRLAGDIYRKLIYRGASTAKFNLDGEHLNQNMKAIFAKLDINSLASGLDEDYPGAFQVLLGSLKDYAKWNWLEPILIQGLILNPKKFVPEVSMVLGLPYEMHDLPEEFLLRENVLKGVFPTRSQEVVELLGNDFDFNPALNRQEDGLNFSLVKIRAQKWLAKNTQKSDSEVVKPDK